MDFDQFFDRSPVSNGPLSLLVRLADRTRIDAAFERAAALLHGRRSFDQLVFLIPGGEIDDLPAQTEHFVVTLCPTADVESSDAVENALRACHRPVVVCVDENILIDPKTLRELLLLADHCDVVVGRRRSGLRLLFPLELAARWLFSVPVSDPLCPVKAMRRAAIEGLVLQTRYPLVEFELLAKLTFTTVIVDELPVELEREESLLQTLAEQFGELTALLLKPRFWHVDPTEPRFRPPLHLPPTPASTRPPEMSSRPSRRAWGPGFPKASLR